MSFLTRTLYLRNVEAIISDTTKFSPIKFDKDEVNHMISMQKKICNVLQKLENYNKISKKQSNDVLSMGSRPLWLGDSS